MTAMELKQYIYANKKVGYILESIGCHSIYYHDKGYYSCGNYNGDNKTAINVFNDRNLSVIDYTRENEIPRGSDIFTLIQYNKKMKFSEAIKYTHELLDIEFTFKHQSKVKEKPKLLSDFFLNVVDGERYENHDNSILALNESVLSEYTEMLYYGWWKERIMPYVRDRFGIMYSYHNNRIIIPYRHWLTGELVGYNARTTVENYELLGIKKYYISPSYKKGNNLYGLWENKSEIEKNGIVVVFESEKSVLIRSTFMDNNCVALSGKFISEEQTRILIGLNVEIVIALDKDVCQKEINFICEKFYGIRKVSYISDGLGLLNEKDSPADASNKVYQYLLKHRKEYGTKEHNEYLKRNNGD